MTDRPEQLERALLTIRQLRETVERLQSERTEPIAIIGMSCRFPGADNLSECWRLLSEGRDAVGEVPADRWNIDDYYDPDPDRPGRISTRRGGFLRDADKFDAAFFSISRREALQMDPQQRLLLEVSWEAIEHAGIAPLSLAGSRTGVFAGISCSYYGQTGVLSGAGGFPDVYTIAGNATNAAAGRLSYFLGLQGPSLAIDTACSSALVAVHLACQSLHAGETDLAVASGVNLILTPDGSIALSRMRTLAPDGRCKTFDRAADGFARGEGCGVVVLKRLSNALRDRDRALALIRGSAVNQDGRSGGFTVPSGVAQQAVIRAALERAQVSGSEISYIEAHGTGTPLGDPIEMEALVHVLCRDFPGRAPLVVGSAKTNFGHLEAAAGVAGLVKVVLSMRHGLIPPHLHFSEWNPHIPLEGAPVVIPTKPTPWPDKPWPDNGASRLAGVSSFGMSGTNAHLILEQAPPQPAEAPADGQFVFTFSAKDPAALSPFAARVVDWLDNTCDVSLAALCYNACVRRSHFPHRMAIVAASITELRERLAAGQSFPGSGSTEAERLATRYLDGADVDWKAFFGGRVWRVTDLPTYLFQRQRYWPDGARAVPEPRGVSAVHPLLGERIVSAGRDIIFESSLNAGTAMYLDDHRIFDMVVVPSVVYMEMALAAAREALFPQSQYAIADLVVREPLVLEQNLARILQFVIAPDGETTSFGIFSRGASGATSDTKFVHHASGRLVKSEPASGAFRREEVQARCPNVMQTPQVYAMAGELGLMAGPSFRSIRQMWTGPNESLVHVELPAELWEEAQSYTAHPCLLDGCLQAVGGAIGASEDDSLYLPIGLERMELRGKLPHEVWCRARIREPRAAGAETVIIDLTVVDHDGRPLAEMIGVTLKKATRDAMRRLESDRRSLLYRMAWEKIPFEAGDPAPAKWMVVDNAGGVGQELARQLKSASAAAPPGIVFLASLDSEPASDTTKLCGDLLALLQKPEMSAGPARLYLVTRGAWPVLGTEPISAAQSALWGLFRVVRQEFPNLSCVSIDLDPVTENPEETARIIAREISAAGREDEVAWRGGERYAARLERFRPAGGSAVTLRMGTRGSLDDLELAPAVRRAPGPQEVEVHVAAAGLAFRDVLATLAMYPGPAPALGGEFAGRITKVGSEVRRLQPGDEVMGLGAAAFSTYCITEAQMVVRRPAGVNCPDAATVPGAYVTAAYGLEVLARIRPGQRMLIHAGAGGVGLMAVRLAQSAGAEVWATAGSPEKRAYLAGLGVAHVMNSRTLDFAAEIRESTGGAGVDIVLNSLSGEFIPASLSTLGKGGCFLEIGKRGAWTSDRMFAARPDVRYHCYDVGELCVREPEVMSALLEKMRRGLEDGSLAPLPRTDFDFEDASRAFRYMAQARHIGRIVLNRREAAGIGGAWLITGGLGALGLRVADWLAKQGVQALVLASRSGASEPAKRAIDEIRRSGIRVRTEKLDVADRSAVHELIDRIPDLRGVVHAAGVVEDGMLAHQTSERFERVLAPKVAGAWNLHLATRDRSLDHFVLFSSVAALLGGPGQGSYAAANSFLDGLAHHRRTLGLPALSIAWGPWSEGGMADNLDEVHRRRRRTNGIGSIEPRQGLAAMGELLWERAAQIAVLPIDWETALRQYPAGAQPTLFARFGKIATGIHDKPGATEGHLLQAVQSAAPAQRRSVLITLLRQEIARVLALESSASIGLAQPLSELGLDSLMAVELRIALSNGFSLPLASTTLFDYPRLDALAAHLESQLFPPEAAPPKVAPEAAHDNMTDDFGDLLDAIETLGDAQVREMLTAKT